MAYQAVKSALATGSYILWIDAGLNVVAAIIAYVVWRKRNKPSVYAYMIAIFIPIAFFMSTGYYQEAVIRLFPLVLIYFVVKPVWDSM